MPRRNPDLARALARLARVADEQGGACTAAQARAAGLSAGAVTRLVASGRWTAIHRGVYLLPGDLLPGDLLSGDLLPGGAPGLAARMWAAHLALGPGSVVAGRTAAHHWGLLDGAPARHDAVEMLLPEGSRRVARGTRVRRVPEPARWAHPARMPPVLSVEHTVLDLVARAGSEHVVAEVVLRAHRMRLTTPDRLLAALDARPRVRGRRLVVALCAQARDGVTSPLELLYRTRVERAHRLPSGRMQVPGSTVGGRRVHRDVAYEGYGFIVELDGRLGHEEESSVLRDHLRDNAAALQGWVTFRYGWLAVAGSACVVADQVGAMLRRGGWSGKVRPCGPACTAGGWGRSGAA
jgi:hypothetical protein